MKTRIIYLLHLHSFPTTSKADAHGGGFVALFSVDIKEESLEGVVGEAVLELVAVGGVEDQEEAIEAAAHVRGFVQAENGGVAGKEGVDREGGDLMSLTNLMKRKPIIQEREMIIIWTKPIIWKTKLMEHWQNSTWDNNKRMGDRRRFYSCMK